MSTLSPELLLATWERARDQTPSARAKALLEAARVDAGADATSIGRRDRELLAIFLENFGSTFRGVGTCVSCGTELELTLEAQTLLAEPVKQGAPVVAIDGMDVPLRLPSVDDVLAASAATEPSRQLAALCSGLGAASLTHDNVVLIVDAVLAADPLLDPQMAGTCPECGADQEFGLDVAGFLWERVEARAHRLMGQVHLLARAYGWSERDILALPPARRSAYLAMVTA